MTTAAKLSPSDTRKLAKEVAKLLTMPSKPIANRTERTLPAPSDPKAALSLAAYSELRTGFVAARRRLAHVKQPEAKLKFIIKLAGLLLHDSMFTDASITVDSVTVPDGWVIKPGRPRKQ